MLLQHQTRQQPAADPRATETIVLDSAAETSMPRLAPTHRRNSQHQQQARTPGHQLQQPQAASSQAGYQARPAPRFGPDYGAPSGSSPCFRATPPTAARGLGSSFRSPSQRLGLRATGGSLSADPNGKLLDKLMDDLSMHQPYDPHAPLPPASTIQQSSVSTTSQVDLNLDLDAVIARYAFRTHFFNDGVGVSMSSGIACHAML